MSVTRKSLFVFFVLFVLSGCTNMHADFKTGKEARRSGDYVTALHHLEPLADFGVEDAQYELALLLLRREDSSVSDYDRAHSLLLGIQGQRKPQALFEIGRIYQKGYGVPKNIARAKEYYQESGDLGYQRAYYELSRILIKEKDYINAEGLCKHAFLRHYDRAAMCMARLYEEGLGRPADRVEALAWYMVAQRRDVSRASEKVRGISAHLGSQAISRADLLATGLEKNEEIY